MLARGGRDGFAWSALVAGSVFLLAPFDAEAQVGAAEAGVGVTGAQEVEAREIAFARTMADRDFEAFLTFVSPEAIFFDGNRPLRGRDEIGRRWAAFFQGDAAPFSWRPDMVEVLESGRLAMTSGPVLDASGDQIGRFSSVWRKDADGQWRVVFDKGS